MSPAQSHHPKDLMLWPNYSLALHGQRRLSPYQPVWIIRCFSACLWWEKGGGFSGRASAFSLTSVGAFIVFSLARRWGIWEPTTFLTFSHWHPLLPQPLAPSFLYTDHFWARQFQSRSLVSSFLELVCIFLFGVSTCSQGQKLKDAWSTMRIWFHLAVKFFLQTRRSWF